MSDYRSITIFNLLYCITDITDDIFEIKHETKSGFLHRLGKTLDKHLMPTVLCPWGYSEYIHKWGHTPMDIVIAHFLPTCVVKTVTLSSNKVNLYRKNNTSKKIVNKPF